MKTNNPLCKSKLTEAKNTLDKLKNSEDLELYQYKSSLETQNSELLKNDCPSIY